MSDNLLHVFDLFIGAVARFDFHPIKSNGVDWFTIQYDLSIDSHKEYEMLKYLLVKNQRERDCGKN